MYSKWVPTCNHNYFVDNYLLAWVSTCMPALLLVRALSLNLTNTNPCPTSGIILVHYKALRLQAHTCVVILGIDKAVNSFCYTWVSMYFTGTYMYTWVNNPSSGMGDLHASVDAFCMGLPSTSGLPNLDAQVCIGAWSWYATAWSMGQVGSQWSGYTCSCLLVSSTGMKCEHPSVPRSRLP